MTMKELGIDTWPHDKLRALVHEIYDVLEPEEDSGVPWHDPEFVAELHRRSAEADAHPELLQDWDDIYAATKLRLKSQ